jgi:hypothetical protein
MRARYTALGTVVKGHGPSGHRHGAQEIGVQDQTGSVFLLTQGTQATEKQHVLINRWFAFVIGQAFRNFQHGATGGVATVIARDVAAERVVGDHLGDGVEIAASLMKLNGYVSEWLYARTKTRIGFTNALSNSPHLSEVVRQERDNAIGFTQLVGAKHDRIVTVTLQQDTALSLRAIDRTNDGLEGCGHDVGIDSHSPKDFARHRALQVRGCSGIATS